MAHGSRTKNRLGKAEQARATRRRILEAASTLFLRDGFLTTTMTAIASDAGVAVQTLYLSFGSKTAILSAAFDVALAGDDESVPLFERPWMRSAVDNPDGRAGLSDFLCGSASVIERGSRLYGVIRAAAADPEVAQILSSNKQARHDVYRQVVEAVAGKPGFNSRLNQTDALGILYAVQSEETYALLVEEHGWTAQQWRDWAMRTVLAELFPERGAHRGDQTASQGRAGRLR